MNYIGITTLAALVAVTGEWEGKGLEAKTVFGFFVVLIFLTVFNAYDPKIATGFAALILLGTFFTYGVPFTNIGAKSGK